jgi:phosphonate degradation associated HDIG domain protein
MTQTNSPSAPGWAHDPQRTIEEIFTMFELRGGNSYIGEPVSQSEHALQAAHAAELAGAGSALITAALLHDIGHLVHNLPEDCADHGVDDRHEELGARWLIRRFGPEVVEPIRLHVAAKRYLCATEPRYHAALSPASQQSLVLQGGMFTPAEVADFDAGLHAKAAVALRKWDDIAKVPGLPTPQLVEFRRHIVRVLE